MAFQGYQRLPGKFIRSWNHPSNHQPGKKMKTFSPSPQEAEVLVIGAGLAGLTCAKVLHAAAVDVHVVEASDGIGGRIRTDELDGFLLDRGFQVILTAYEELAAHVDLPELDLRAFSPGSLVWNGEKMVRLSDPWREPAAALSSLRAPLGTFKDKMIVANLRRKLMSKPPEAAFHGPDRSTQAELEGLGLSEGFIDTFFRPFLGGVFLERALETSAHLFRYYFRCFSAGDAALPAEGMEQLPRVLAGPLQGRISVESPVVKVSRTGAKLRDGTFIDAGQVVLAVDGLSAAKLLGEAPPPFKPTVTSYFAAPEAPTDLPLLALDGEGTGPANHVAVVSNVAPRYAPSGGHLVSVSGVDEAAGDPEEFRAQVPRQLRRWFGSSVDRWEHLRTYRIPAALPRHPAGTVSPNANRTPRPDGLVVAGDYTEFGAIQGAMVSGRRAAEHVLDLR
jgi:phytoene dehydrogenase-like protein